MAEHTTTSVEDRLRAIEDRLAIYQIVCGYGYAIDGCNAATVGDFYAEDGVYAVGDIGAFEGRAQIEAIASSAHHLGLVNAGCAHVSTLPYVVIDGDHAVATCHTMVVENRTDGFVVGRLSASRLKLSRKADDEWRIDHRQNHMMTGDGSGPTLLARLNESPLAPA